MLIAEGLCCERGGRTVLSDVSLGLRAGEVLGVLGANGAGKTSLLATLAGELRPAGGRLTLDGQPLQQWASPALARRRAVLPQSPSLAFELAVRVVVEMGSYPFPELTPQAVDALVARALALADVRGLGARRYGALSGGEQQRVQFARTLVQLLAARSGAAAREYRVLFLTSPPPASTRATRSPCCVRSVRSRATKAWRCWWCCTTSTSPPPGATACCCWPMAARWPPARRPTC